MLSEEERAAIAEVGLSEEEIGQLRPFSRPVFYASAFRLQTGGNDFNLTLSRALPAENPDGSIHPKVGKHDPVAVITMSPQSLKDLYLLLRENLAAHEKAYGTIETPFSKKQEEAATAAEVAKG